MIGTPAIGNIDDDDELEVIIGGFSGGDGRKLFAFNHDMTPVLGFPILIGEKIKKGASLADFNNNGKDDIVFGTDSDNIYLILDHILLIFNLFHLLFLLRLLFLVFLK